MAISRSAWQEYDRWNEVVADVLFPELDRPAPVYLDVEDHEIEEIGARVGVDADKVISQLMGVVGSTIDRDSVTGGFKDHLKRVVHWQKGPRVDAYPAVATLAAFSLAAEQMASGDGLASNNYYGRLANLLGGSKDRLHQSYMKSAEPLWAGLNLWLDRLDGHRGTPTAYALGKRFIGLPMSQALVREADRRRLERFFVDFDLAPRSEIPAPEIEPLLGLWFGREHQTSHLGKLWAKVGLRERIAEVAAVELQAWDGIDTSDEAGETRAGRALLALRLRKFPKPQVQIFPFFLVKNPLACREATLVLDSGDAIVDLVPANELDQAMVLGGAGAIDPASLVGGVLTVRDQIGGEMTRLPRGVVVFRKDELSGLWIEAKQVLMGDDVVLLALDRSAARVRDLLADIARPGWVEDASRLGLPEGWSLFEKVEVFARPGNESTVHGDLRALVPLTSSQLKFSGGLSLPGASRSRWHSARPPHIRAVSDSGSGFTVQLKDLGGELTTDEGVIVVGWTDEGSGSVIVDGTDLQLDDGRYAVEMIVGSNVVARREFSLHSSDTRDEVQWSGMESIVHDLGDPLAVLSAGERTDRANLVQGVLISVADTDETASTSSPPSAAWWKPRSDQARPKGLTLRAPDPGSCFYTGAHRFELPTAMRDNERTKYVSACTQCGMKKSFSGSYYRNAAQHTRRQETAEFAGRVDVRSLPPITATEDDQRSWDVALDALRCLGGGPMSTLERVVRQIEPSSLFLNEFVATLEALGHLEVRRSADRLVAEAWEIAPSAVVDTGHDRVLAGYWTPGLIAHLEERCQDHGRSIVVERPGGGLTRTATDATEDELAEWLHVGGVLLAGSAGDDLAERLPALSAVVRALPRNPTMSYTDVQVFDPTSARWASAFGMDGVGAYRTGRYASTYYIRTEADVAAGTTAVATAYLAKHWAAVALTGKPLLAYSEKHTALVVPLGALLPGMYQRAVVLDSGIAPERVRGQNHLYRDVSAAVAGRITYLLEN